MTDHRVEDDLWWQVGLATLGAAYETLFRVQFSGLRNIPSEGPALLAANHVSVLDPIAIALGPSRIGRTVRFLAAAEFFDRPIIGRGLRVIKQIPVRRGERDIAALQQVAAVINRGALAGIFPEGGLGEGALRPGKRGAARIALAGHVPVIPVAVWGTQIRWPKSGIKLRPPLRPIIHVAFGRSILAQGDPASAADVQALTDRLMGSLRDLLERVRAVTPPG